MRVRTFRKENMLPKDEVNRNKKRVAVFAQHSLKELTYTIKYVMLVSQANENCCVQTSLY